jgi:hypothetical protein
MRFTMPRFNFLFPLILLFALQAKANLRPQYLSMQLSSEKSSYAHGETLLFFLKFSNGSQEQASVLLPGHMKSGKKMVYFSFFRVENNFYHEVYREERDITIDTTKGGEDIRHLNPGESYSIPIFFNDDKNFASHHEAHHHLPDLPFGEYQVLAWYYPWDDYLAQYVYNKVDDFDKNPEKERMVGHFDLNSSGINSNYHTLHIVESPVSLPPWQPTRFCPMDCKMCLAIDEGDWKKVSNIIDQQTEYKHKSDTNNLDTTWRQAHRNVTWLGPDPQAVLSSLPTWTHRYVIYKNAEGYHYFFMSWQIGIVYRQRSRFSRIFYWMGMRKSPIKLSEVDYFKLVQFKPY